MRKINLYRYCQTNSGGSFKDTKKSYVKDAIFPLKQKGDFEKIYKDIGVTAKTIIPKMIYFDGVEKGLDCECCGDRWDELWEDEATTEVFIFEDLKDYENNKSELMIYSQYCIVSELEEC